MSISSSISNKKLSLLFLWHMHQPFYKDALSGRYTLPWVRLHGSKDYLDMVTILNDFPNIRQNINVVPSLLQQIAEYADGKASDTFLELSAKPTSSLTDDDKAFILENFFLANWDNLIKPFPRYYDLLQKRGVRFSSGEIKRAIHYFSDADFTDLQLLFNLAWIDPHLRTSDPELKELEQRGAHFNDTDKLLVINKQLDILKQIIPTYKQMHDDGRIELSVTPYFHPILPLLCDSESARSAMSDVTLPSERFLYPEDADAQIKLAIEYFKDTFGFVPQGMWPSEGSVSEDTVRIIRDNNIKWIATDEAVLSASLGKEIRDDKGTLKRPDLLYSDYSYKDVSIFFRDHALSDLIGFVYSTWDPEKAAHDFHNRLIQIDSMSITDAPRVVSIILDGENAWEYYKNDGRDFLNTLYRLINDDNRIQSITASELLQNHSSRNTLDKLHAGSWIYGNFAIWIGHEEDNIAWDYISQTRRDLIEAQRNDALNTEDAWMNLYAAEGSDWFWWYGDDHVTDNSREFDELFRNNLIAVYNAIGKEIPGMLHVPVLREDRGVRPALPIRGFITPTIDGEITSYFEWLEGTFIDVRKSGGSMHKSESIIAKIYYGFNADNLYIRADSKEKFKDVHDCNCVTVYFVKPSNIKITAAGDVARLHRKDNGEWLESDITITYAAEDIFEIAIPFEILNVNVNDEISFYLTADLEGQELERYPWRGNITLHVPSPNFDAMMWY